MSTSVAYLRKRLAAIGRHDLLAAVDRGELRAFVAAEAAGLIKRQPVTGNGSQNQARKRRYAVARATGPALPLPPESEPQPEPQPHAVSPLPPEVRAIVVKLVKAGRADLICDVAEFRLSPHQAEAIADRDEQRRTESGAENSAPESGFSNEKPQKRRTPKAAVDPNESTEKRGGKPKAVEPETLKLDVRCLIA
jgi:hypothetical protein